MSEYRRRRLLRRTWSTVGWLGLSVVLGSCGRATRPGEATIPRFAAVRVSRTTAWAPCTGAADSATTALSCRVVRGPVVAPPVTATVHDRALADLAYSAETPDALPRAVTQLRSLVDSMPSNPQLRNDLAAALLLTALKTQALLPGLQALDAAERARRDAPDDPAIAWNVALAQEFLQLPAAALQTWQLVLQLERDPQWRAELEARMERLQRLLTESRVLMQTDSILSAGGTADSAQITQIAARMPQWRRDRAFLVLAGWATCMERGDTVCAAANRRQLQAISASEAPDGGDTTATWLVHDLDRLSSSNAAARQRGVQRYLTLGRAMAAYRQGDYDTAVPFLEQVHDPVGQRTAPGVWSRYYLGGSEVNRGRYEQAQRLFDALGNDANPPLPVLAGKALLSLGVIAARRGNTERAVQFLRRGQQTLAGVRDDETKGFVSFLLAESLGLQGRRLDSYTEALQSLRRNSGFRKSATLRSQVAQVAQVAGDEGLPFAAVSIANESVEIARALKQPAEFALALRDRARYQLQAGQDSLAVRDLDSAGFWAAKLGTGRGFDRLRAIVQLGRGEVLRQSAPRASLEALQQAVSMLRAFRDDIFLSQALYQTARTQLVLGDTIAAHASLLDAMQILEGQYSTFTSGVLRASYAETAEEVFDTEIELQFARRNIADAFHALERSKRAAFQPSWMRRDSVVGTATSLQALQGALPAGTVTLVYAVLPQRLIIWRVSRDTVVTAQVAISRDSLARLATRARDAILQGDEPRAQRLHTALYDHLITQALRPADTAASLIVVADRELFQVAFALLRDRVSQRYLVESHEIAYAPSAAFVRSVLSRESAAPGAQQVLALGNNADPDFVDDTLPALRAAEREAAAVGALYSRREVLTGRAVSRLAVQRGLPKADLLHFAGHAVFDEARPERSYLLLAGVGESARYRAEEIAMLRSSRLRLVVLSACRTLNARASRVGPVSGLAYSFLQAGASGSITSLWDVEDGGAAEFMAAMHRSLARGLAPAAALRQVQREFLQSTDPSRRASRQWAAFTLTGR